MSHRVHRADLAISTDGTVLLNMASFDRGLDVAALLELALAEPGSVFIGITINAAEVSAVLGRFDNAAAEAAARIVAGRQRRRRGRARKTRRKAS